jgi:A/G-specific adenine glycosylase
VQENIAVHAADVICLVAFRNVTLPTELVLAWYRSNRRDLPWRRTRDPWAVVVSEVMLQQTPVARVLPAYDEWLRRWPTPAALAAEPAGEAVRLWGRLGYPRRALRLHQLAVVVTQEYGGVMPRTVDELLTLPGIGAYTARAVASFAYAQRHPVVDTNVRRVVARSVAGQAAAGLPSVPRDLETMEALLPVTAPEAAEFSVAVMELGALVCTARTPRCDECPVADSCAWLAAGRPAYDGLRRRSQAWHGTDRQARGALLAVLRATDIAVPAGGLEHAWPEHEQRRRALDSLVADGLVHRSPEGFALPR